MNLVGVDGRDSAERPDHPRAGIAVPGARPAAPTLDVATVRVLHAAVRASLRLSAGLDAAWTWPGHPESEFVRAVRGHHVSGVIGPHSEALRLPATLAAGIAAHADRTALAALAHAGWIRQVHGRLTRAGIPGIFLKGLAVEAQTGRPLGSRGGGDIDILVPVDQVGSAVVALSPLWRLPDGYPTPGPSWAWRHCLRWGSEMPLRGPITVDLHWKLRSTASDLPDFPAAWAARAQVAISGQPVPTLGPADALTHACRHAAADRWRILRSLVDIHLLLRDSATVGHGGAEPVPPVGRSIGIVERSIGLPSGRRARALSDREWSDVLEEQRHLGSHTDRNSLLTRPDRLRRMLGRWSPASRRPIQDALSLLSAVAVPPPHQLGPITTTSTVRGVSQGIARRVRYELGRK